MAGERTKLTAVEKGKESGLRRSARNRNPPPRMDRVTPSPQKRARDDTPHSRKKSRDDNFLLTALPSPPAPNGNGYLELFSKASPAVVTVAFDKFVGSSTKTTFRTGFIIVVEENYAMVLTTLKPDVDGPADKLSVYFGGVRSQAKVYEVENFKKENLLLLLVQTDEKYEAVNLSSDALGYEAIFTVSALSGTKLNNRANAPFIKEMEGCLGFFKGTVGTPSCRALNASGKHMVGSEKYFQLGFCMHDNIITLSNVDDMRHKAEVAMSSPVFRLDGNTAGMISSDGGWIDSKIGLLAESIILCLETKFGVEWKEELKLVARTLLSGSQ